MDEWLGSGSLDLLEMILGFLQWIVLVDLVHLWVRFGF